MGREAAGWTLGEKTVPQMPVTGLERDNDPATSGVQAPPSGRIGTGRFIRRPAEPFWTRLHRGLAANLVKEQEQGVAFLFVPVFLGIGVILYFSLTVEPGFLQLGLVGGILVALAMACRRIPAAQLLVFALLAIAAGLLAAKFETWSADTKVLGSEITTRVTKGEVMARSSAL